MFGQVLTDTLWVSEVAPGTHVTLGTAKVLLTQTISTLLITDLCSGTIVITATYWYKRRY